MVIRIAQYIGAGIEATDDYRITKVKSIADLNFEVDFTVNGAIGMIVTKWEFNIFG